MDFHHWVVPIYYFNKFLQNLQEQKRVLKRILKPQELSKKFKIKI